MLNVIEVDLPKSTIYPKKTTYSKINYFENVQILNLNLFYWSNIILLNYEYCINNRNHYIPTKQTNILQIMLANFTTAIFQFKILTLPYISINITRNAKRTNWSYSTKKYWVIIFGSTIWLFVKAFMYFLKMFISPIIIF